MLTWLKQKRDHRRTARVLYGSIVTQARQAAFYARHRVPDTAEGRFEMVALHLVMVLHRLVRTGEPGRRLQQATTEAFVIDMDDAMREMSVGDLAVPRHVKRAVAVLHDRFAIYGKALASPRDGPLVEAIEARLRPLQGAEGLDAGGICAYIRQATQALELLEDARILAGRIDWPQPGAPGRDPHIVAR